MRIESKRAGEAAGNRKQTATRAGPAYRVGQLYPVTEVLGCWHRRTTDEPEWIPVAGRLHDDIELFQIRPTAPKVASGASSASGRAG